MPAGPRSRPFVVALSAGLDRATRLGAWSRQANDIAQWVFALYVALALREATRQRAHMAAGLFVARYPLRWRHRIARFGEAICVLPWAIFVLVTGAMPTWQSVVGLEAFPDTYNPLYFVIRASAWMLALLVALQAIVDLAGEPATAPRSDADREDREGLR